MRLSPFREHLADWSDPWRFAHPHETRARLERAGFRDVETSLEEAPTTIPTAAAFAEFIACVCLRHHLARLPDGLRNPFVAALTDRASRDTPPFTLDYWRLNIAAWKARA